MKRLRVFYWIMIVGFIALMTFMAINKGEGDAYPYVWFTLDAIFLAGGIGLIVVTLKEKVTGWLKKCLLASGALSILFLIVMLLQNGLWILRMSAASIALYYVGMFAIPIVFAIVVILTGWLLYRQRQS